MVGAEAENAGELIDWRGLVRIELELADRHRIGDTVPVTVRYVNVSDRTLAIDYPWRVANTGSGIRFTLKRYLRDLAPFSAESEEGEITVTLDAADGNGRGGGFIERTFILNDLFDLGEPALYSLRAFHVREEMVNGQEIVTRTGRSATAKFYMVSPKPLAAPKKVSAPLAKPPVWRTHPLETALAALIAAGALFVVARILFGVLLGRSRKDDGPRRRVHVAPPAPVAEEVPDTARPEAVERGFRLSGYKAEIEAEMEKMHPARQDFFADGGGDPSAGHARTPDAKKRRD